MLCITSWYSTKVDFRNFKKMGKFKQMLKLHAFSNTDI